MYIFGFFINESVKLFLIVFLLLKFIDFTLGIIKAFLNSEFEAKILKEGLLKWTTELLAIGMVLIIDTLFSLNSLLINPTISLFILKEYSSVNKNLNNLGIQLPNIVEVTINKLFNNKEE